MRTFPTELNVYGPPEDVDCPTSYPDTAQPTAESAEVHVSVTCALPAVADRDGVETKGKYKKPAKSLNEVAVELPEAICETTPERPKFAEEENPPGKSVGVDIV